MLSSREDVWSGAAVGGREASVTKAKSEDERDKKIEDLKRRAETLSRGKMMIGGLDDCPGDAEEAFWEQLLEYEEAPWTTYFHQLESAGVSLPAPDSLNDQELTVKLWEVIHKLALLQVFIEETDHLSDRELYTHLWTDSLREETKALPMTSNSAHHIPMLGESEADSGLYLKYYADDTFRKDWQKNFPNDPISAHEAPRWNRDHLLPKPGYSLRSDREPN